MRMNIHTDVCPICKGPKLIECKACGLDCNNELELRRREHDIRCFTDPKEPESS